MGDFKMIGNNTDKLEKEYLKQEQFNEALTSALIETIELNLRDTTLEQLKTLFILFNGSGRYLELESEIREEL